MVIIAKYKKTIAGLGISLGSLMIVYFVMAAYFTNHFYFGSEINGNDISGKTVEQVKKQMTSELQSYSLNLKGRDDKAEQIKDSEIGLKYSSDEIAKELKEKQNPFNWVSAIFNSEAFKVAVGTSFDKELLKQRIDKLSYFESTNIVEPKNPSFKYTDKGFIIVPEIKGNKVDKDTLYERIQEALLKRENTLDLEAANCYVKSQYASDSPKIIETQKQLNKYASSKVDYTFGDNKEVLDGSIINKWLTVSEKFEVTLDEKEVKNYIDKLSSTYSTTGKTRSFTASSGKTIAVGGGDYGWSIDKDEEVKALIVAIKEGQTISREPEYAQTAFAYAGNDIGNTYVEIDLTNQHLWFYKSGALIVQGDIVTGNVSRGNTTPPGVFKLKYKAKNAVLRGPGYAAPVSFWMPFNGGIGIHDASWRNKFGGSIYKTDGSHGCINCPYSLAKAIYENIEPGIPVVCYN